jgi:hypothetical protein
MLYKPSVSKPEVPDHSGTPDALRFSQAAVQGFSSMLYKPGCGPLRAPSDALGLDRLQYRGLVL